MIRKRGYSIDNEEIEIGLRWRRRADQRLHRAMVGAISVAAPSLVYPLKRFTAPASSSWRGGRDLDKARLRETR